MQFETTVEVQAPPEAVWAALVDIQRWPEWTDSMQEVSLLDGATMRVGSSARIRQPRSPALTWTVTELDPGRAFAWQTSSLGVSTVGTHAVAPAGDAHSTLTLGLHQTGALAGLIGALTGARTRRQVQMEAEGLKRAAESGAQADAPPSGSA